jgi:hypothetical protein
LAVFPALAAAPLEVSVVVLLTMTPRLIDSCAAVPGGPVSPDTLAAAQQALKQLDPDHPGKAEALQLWQEGLDQLQVIDSTREDYVEALSTVAGMIIAELQAAGEEGWAEQFAADRKLAATNHPLRIEPLYRLGLDSVLALPGLWLTAFGVYLRDNAGV